MCADGMFCSICAGAMTLLYNMSIRGFGSTQHQVYAQHLSIATIGRLHSNDAPFASQGMFISSHANQTCHAVALCCQQDSTNTKLLFKKAGATDSLHGLQGKVRRMRPSPFNKASGASKSRLAPDLVAPSKASQPSPAGSTEVRCCGVKS